MRPRSSSRGRNTSASVTVTRNSERPVTETSLGRRLNQKPTEVVQWVVCVNYGRYEELVDRCSQSMAVVTARRVVVLVI